MNGADERLARVTKPLRCTALHQSTVATSPNNNRITLRSDSPLQSSSVDSDDNDSLRSADSTEDEDMQPDFGTELEPKSAQSAPFELRRVSVPMERRARRLSSATKLKQKHKAGLTLNHTSPTTAARAIKDVVTKRELSFDKTNRMDISPEQERASFMAELPEAMARARKVHYRRDALLPKPKSFARVQKALREDSTPCEVDVAKEATLARILKDKAEASQPDGRTTEQLGPPITLHNQENSQHNHPTVPVMTTAAKKRQDDGEMFFDMDDINGSIAKCLTSPTSVSRDSEVDSRNTRTMQSRAGRAGKRKVDETRYEPYSISMKRRAVSPSPSSPLGSPNVKGNIVRMEDLSL